MHNVVPNQNHAVISLTVALPPSCSNSAAEVADALNEFLREAVFDGHLADYTLHGLNNIQIVKAGDEPEEGEIFNS